MVKESAPDEIVLDDIMKEGMKNIGKGEAAPVNEEAVVEEPQEEASDNPQFGFKLEPVTVKNGGLRKWALCPYQTALKRTPGVRSPV